MSKSEIKRLAATSVRALEERALALFDENKSLKAEVRELLKNRPICICAGCVAVRKARAREGLD